MTTVTSPKRPLEPPERERLRALDDAVPRLTREYRPIGGYKALRARDASSKEYEALRAFVAVLLRDGVRAGAVSIELSLSIGQVRLWRKEAERNV